MKVLSIALASIFIMSALFAADLPQGYVVGWGDEALYGCDGVPFPRYSAGVVTINGQILSNAMAISAASGHSLALLSDETVFGWGNNTAGWVTGLYSGTEITNGFVRINGNVLSNVVAITAGRLALKSDGTVIGWGLTNDNITIPIGLSNIVAINGGLALKLDGTAVAWGKGIHGDKYVVPAGLSNVVAISASSGYGLALKKDGTVVEWHGHGHGDQTPAGLSNVVAIASGPQYDLALKKDGTVCGWGFNGSGEATGVPTTTSPYTTNGLVEINGQILTNVVAIAAGGSRAGHSLALKKDGTVVSWGYSPFNRLDVPEGLSNVVAIAVGDNYCLAITTNRAVAEKFRH